jgi:hypothetical protein
VTASQYDWSSTRDSIITRALRKIGVLSAGQSASAAQVTQGSEALNEIVKAWQAEDIYIWNIATITQALAINTPVYALTADPPAIALESVQLEYPADTFQELEIISLRDYEKIEDKLAVGAPYLVAYDGKPASSVYVYPAPDADSTYSLTLTIVTKAKDWDATGDVGDLPIRFQRALTYALAADLGDEYGMPVTERDRYENQAMQLLGKATASARDRRDVTVTKGAY